MSYMFDEMHEQPQVLAKLIDAERATAQSVAKEMQRRGIEFVVFAARGTSDHGCVYGKYLLEINNSLTGALADPSIFTHYSASLRLKNALVIGVSQSGEATDVCEYLARSKELGALTLAITNEPNSDITNIADFTMQCHAGSEKAVAATKTYTSCLAAFYLLSACISENDGKIEDLRRCSELMQSVFSIEDHIKQTASRYRFMSAGPVLARGMNYCTALEISLKMAETCYVKTRGYSAADFLHGPIASVHEGDPCFMIAAAGQTYTQVLEVAEKLRQRNADTLIISTEDDALVHATVPIKMPKAIPEDLSPLVYIIPGQLLAYYLSLERGNDPDRPEGLSKVTLTV